MLGSPYWLMVVRSATHADSGAQALRVGSGGMGEVYRATETKLWLAGESRFLLDLASSLLHGATHTRLSGWGLRGRLSQGGVRQQLTQTCGL